ncbi:NADPH-dependent aldo-keto reductase, chloroplastic-like [Solanum pennellii]|uniref:NADPH-dependent aldo-keto reductase, chloroplastic-like n=1 Tax=Solanum pennellii TaxID=28526 RepID=A0ABM1GDA3_SOLPN|nr:NADPH-dependent aldo-keto reductase, chloroplastic-like [Solanum pennellii]
MRSYQAMLNNGETLPIIGMGTYSGENDRETTEKAIRTAIKMGYRHFDTAKIYGSELALGNALRRAIHDGLIEREDIHVTSKLWSSDHHDPVDALQQTLQRLGMEYIDMYLVHWPVALKAWVDYPVPAEEDFEELDMENTWSGMERCLEMGLCKSIGVSNFSSRKIEELIDFACVTPVVNQVEMHPMWRQSKLRSICGDYGIHVSAYSPLGGPGNAWGTTAVVDHPIIQSIAHKHNATPAQIALRWGLYQGSSVIVKSFNPRRMKENIGALDLTLDDWDLFEIEKMEERKIMRAEYLINDTTSPYKTIEELWDDEI